MTKMTYSESTFKHYKWTVFSQGAAGGKTLAPWDYIAIQAPRGVAEDIMRKNHLDPHEMHCFHCGEDWSISEDVEKPWEFLSWSSHSSMLTIRHDCIGYLDVGYWKIDLEKGVITNEDYGK